MSQRVRVYFGSYRQPFSPSTAGPFGCDPCDICDQRPETGAQIWTDCYGDLVCDECFNDYQEPGSGGLW